MTLDRRDLRPQTRGNGRLLARLEEERWARERENAANCKRWEACQLDPCAAYPHGPSRPCLRPVKDD